MVGRETGSGDQREDVPGLRSAPEGGTVSAERIGVPECCGRILAQGAWSVDCRPCRCAAGETITAGELDDPERGLPFLMACAPLTPPGSVLSYRLVHWIETQRYSWSEMVDGQF